MTLEGGKEEEKLGVRASEDKGEVSSVTGSSGPDEIGQKGFC